MSSNAIGYDWLIYLSGGLWTAKNLSTGSITQITANARFDLVADAVLALGSVAVFVGPGSYTQTVINSVTFTANNSKLVLHPNFIWTASGLSPGIENWELIDTGGFDDLEIAGGRLTTATNNASDDGGRMVKISAGTDRVRIHDMWIKNASGNTSVCIYGDGNFSEVWVYHNHLERAIYGTRIGLTGDTTNGSVHILNNHVANCAFGLFVAYITNGGSISGNYITDTADNAIDFGCILETGNYMNVSGNTLIRCATSSGNHCIHTDGSDNFTISHNKIFDSNGFGITSSTNFSCTGNVFLFGSTSAGTTYAFDCNVSGGGDTKYGTITGNTINLGNLSTANAANFVTNTDQITFAFNTISNKNASAFGILNNSANKIYIFGNPGWITENNVLSNTFPIDSATLKTVTIAHGLVQAPAAKDCQITVVKNTNVTDWAYNLLIIDSVDATNVTVKINVSTRSLTGAATAKIALMAAIKA